MKKKGIRTSVILGMVLSTVPSCVVDNTMTESSDQFLERITSLEEQIAGINGTIALMEQVDSAVIINLDYLNSKVREDSVSITAINTQISELKAQDSILDAKIKDLRHYVDSLAQHTEEWANGTFSTLKQYEDLCAVVAALSAKVDSLCTPQTADLQSAVSNVKVSMTGWVNDKFTDYYTIAQMDVKLAELQRNESLLHSEIDSQKNTLDTLKTEIKAQKDALDKAKGEITAAYIAAIGTAIESFRGEMSQKILNDISVAKGELQMQMDALKQRIDIVQNRLDAVENVVNGILDRIQSVSVIPDLSDGSVRVMGSVSSFEVRLAIYPLSAAQDIVEKGLPVTFEAVETETKSSSIFTDMEIKHIRYDDELLKLTVSTTGISEAVIKGEKHLFARVSFYSGRYQTATDFFPLTYIK